MSTQTSQATGTLWRIDPAHSNVEFAVKHMMISTVRGRFAEVEGSVDASDPQNPQVEATIQVESIDTRQEQRDQHLRSADFFAAEEFPTITFRSTGVEGDPTGAQFTLQGELTIRGTTRPITLDVTAEGRGKDPWGGQRAGFTAKGKIRRGEFGLKWNQALETGGVLVGDEVRITIETELVQES